jgi:hypothetical protein
MALAKPGSKSDKKADPKSDSKNNKGGQDTIMPVSEMRAVMSIARQSGSATVAFAQNSDHEGVLLMDRRISPKKLLKDLKDKAGKASMRLDASAMRFGRIQIEGSGHVTFVVNRETSPNMRPKLLEHLKAIGYSHLQIVVDLSLESEPEDEQVDAAAAGAAAATKTEAADHIPGDPASASSEPAPTGADPRATAQTAALTKTLNDLAQQMRLAITANPVQERFLKPIALKAAQALKDGDLTAAASGIAALQGALGTAAAPTSGAAAANSGPAARKEPASQKTIANARIAWIATRQKVEADLDKLHAAFTKAFKGHHMEADLTGVFRQRVDTVLDTLDENLAHMLNDLNDTSDMAERSNLVDGAHALIAKYVDHIDTDKTIEQLDRNPFIPVAIRKTMEATLTTLSRAIR